MSETEIYKFHTGAASLGEVWPDRYLRCSVHEQSICACMEYVLEESLDAPIPIDSEEDEGRVMVPLFSRPVDIWALVKYQKITEDTRPEQTFYRASLTDSLGTELYYIGTFTGTEGRGTLRFLIGAWLHAEREVQGESVGYYCHATSHRGWHHMKHLTLIATDLQVADELSKAEYWANLYLLIMKARCLPCYLLEAGITDDAPVL